MPEFVREGRYWDFRILWYKDFVSKTPYTNLLNRPMKRTRVRRNGCQLGVVLPGT